ncbi:MAG: YaaL family protein [Clostridiales bacterium]|nr:YaaL family protein [Clostridiales bacterium]
MELDELLRSLSRTQREIDLAYNHFNFTSDPDLIESCVYEISSLQCRYNYLLRRVKERGGSAVIGALPGREV